MVQCELGIRDSKAAWYISILNLRQAAKSKIRKHSTGLMWEKLENKPCS